MPVILRWNIYCCQCGAVFKKKDMCEKHVAGRKGHQLVAIRHVELDSRDWSVKWKHGPAKEGYES